MENVEKYIKNYVNLTEIDKDNVSPEFSVRIEGRTSNDDITEALRFCVHDPLWMLARQWQLGEFRGNDCGTAMSVSCKIKEEDCGEIPLEPRVEQINPEIDLMARIQSAVYFLDLASHLKVFSGEKLKEFKENALKRWPIEWERYDSYALGHDATSEFEKSLNDRKTAFIHSYRHKIFDGYKLYEFLCKYKLFERLENNDFSTVNPITSELKNTYIQWFEKKYLPADEINKHWQEKDLCYQLKDQVGIHEMEGDRYNGGRLSWYSVDYKKPKSGLRSDYVTRDVMSLPTLANFASAPNRRLWQIEDRKVFMGNSLEKQSSGNIAMMKYTTMFSNDWMLFPLDTQIGKYIELDSINVVDTFGDSITIDGNSRAGKKDTLKAFEESWQMFTNTRVGNPSETPRDGLYYAAQLANTLEGKPIEDIKMLRDEMSNMVWGVEEVVSDGCGSTMDAKLNAAKLTDFVDDLYKTNRPKPTPKKVVFSEAERPQVEQEELKADFKYLLQSTVPFNWIPFVPQRLTNVTAKERDIFMLGGREIILRRGKMPCYIWHKENEDVAIEKIPVRPLSSILRKGIVKEENTWEEKPLFFNEEAVQSTGIRLVKNYQRARWLDGATYNWLGIYKRLAKTEATSGLEFDVLKKNE